MKARVEPASIATLSAADIDYLESETGYTIPTRDNMRKNREIAMATLRKAAQDAARYGAYLEEMQQAVVGGFEEGAIEGVHDS